MKRDTAQTIFRTVVFAGAMLGAPACSKKPAATTPTSNTNTTQPTTPVEGTSATTPETTEDADPCAGDGRIRGTDDDGGGGEGRGFILS